MHGPIHANAAAVVRSQNYSQRRANGHINTYELRSKHKCRVGFTTVGVPQISIAFGIFLLVFKYPFDTLGISDVLQLWGCVTYVIAGSLAIANGIKPYQPIIVFFGTFFSVVAWCSAGAASLAHSILPGACATGCSNFDSVILSILPVIEFLFAVAHTVLCFAVSFRPDPEYARMNITPQDQGPELIASELSDQYIEESTQRAPAYSNPPPYSGPSSPQMS